MLQDRNAITLRSGVQDRPKLTSYSDSPYPKPPPHISWYPRVFVGGFTEPNSISARAGIAVPAGNRFGSVNPPKNTHGYQEMCGGGFGYGESEYEVSFGLAPRNGELSPSVPETQEPFNSPFRARNPERSSDSNSPQNLGSVSQNLGSWAYTPRDKLKGQWLNQLFFESGEWRFF